jgi:hypothetical protein
LAHFASAVGAGSQMERATPRPRLPNRAWGTLRGRRRKERSLHCQPNHLTGSEMGRENWVAPVGMTGWGLGGVEVGVAI